MRIQLRRNLRIESNLKVLRTNRLSLGVLDMDAIVVQSLVKLSMSFLSSLASVVEFLNQMKRNHRY